MGVVFLLDFFSSFFSVCFLVDCVYTSDGVVR